VTLLQFFIIALMGMYQQARGQVVGFGGTKYICMGEILLLLLQGKTKYKHDKCHCGSPVVQFNL